MSNYANVIMIRNESGKDVLFRPVDERFDYLTKLVKADHYIIFEPHLAGFLIDMDQTYFQFVNKKRKIKPHKVGKYGIKLEFIDETKKRTCYDDVSAKHNLA